MTVIEKAKQIVKDGFKQDDINTFINKTGRRDVLDYIALFESCGVEQSKIWDAYEEWQTS